MRTLYHEFESLEHLLGHRLLPGGSGNPIRFVVFGGTGAVGGASVLELCRMILMSKSLRQSPLAGEIYATGIADKDISKFAGRLYLALGDEVEIEKIEPLRHYRLDGRIDLHFSLLRLQAPSDLEGLIPTGDRGQQGSTEVLETALGEYFAAQPCPFQGFVESLGSELLHAVLVAIPLPSVATYTLGAIDRFLAQHGFDHAAQQRVKKSYLRTFIGGLAVIQQRYARHVVIAHTTAVGGMYRVDGGTAEIRLGFAHSSLGKKMVEKKYFADELTQLYLDHGFDVLITASAIGIDGVEFRERLPLDRAVQRKIRECAQQAETPPVPPSDLESAEILLYPSRRVRLAGDEAEQAVPVPADRADHADLTTTEETDTDTTESEAIDAEARNGEALEGEADGGGGLDGDPEARDAEIVDPDPPLEFGGGKDLIVDTAIRSGENGIFSVGNCIALYHVMKVAIPEELAMVLVRHAVFGPERRRDWFIDKVAYYTETENSYFAIQLLHSTPRLVRAHYGAFSIQAYQALGSATHQARMHELGLLLLVLRLLELGEKFEEIPEQELVDGLSDLGDFLWRHTRIPSFEDLAEIDGERSANLFGRLCEIDSMDSAGQFLGYEARTVGVREPGRERFLARLATWIGRYIDTITSLGIPLLYRSPRDGGDHILLGPYVAPLDRAVARQGDVERAWSELATEAGVPVSVARDWVIANNGFVDLRPVAIVNTALETGPRLVEQVQSLETRQALEERLDQLEPGAYFTTCGTLALELRLSRLSLKVCGRKIRLGTRETWKHLFEQDEDGRHLISPGLVETARLYGEGLGKITGTEALWPSWGY